MTRWFSFLRGIAWLWVLTGLAAVNLGCFAAVVALDVLGGVAPQFSLPLLIAALPMGGAWLLLARRVRQQSVSQPLAAAFAMRRPAAADASAETAGEAADAVVEESADVRAKSRAAVKPLRRSQPAAANFRSVLIIRHRPEARYPGLADKEESYETFSKAA